MFVASFADILQCDVRTTYQIYWYVTCIRTAWAPHDILFCFIRPSLGIKRYNHCPYLVCADRLTATILPVKTVLKQSAIFLRVDVVKVKLFYVYWRSSLLLRYECKLQ